MLDAFIIEQIRRREKSVDDRPTLQLPLPPGRQEQQEESHPKSSGDEDEGQRGVVIIDFGS